ncbi:MAG: hypothetical protein FWD71_06345 [Oscillospiraceae bacterium]|nr:hypothetical protein [Oscillospiraceae bacterium]
MLSYIKADMYRILHKKSFYIYYAGILAIYLLIMFIARGNLTSDNVVMDAGQIFGLAPLFFGGFIFSMVYNDDLTAKSLPSAIGFGINKIVILFSKIIISTLMSIISLLLMFAVYSVSLNLSGIKIDGEGISALLKMLVSPTLLTVVYMAIASIASFGTQKATIALSIYLALGTGIVGSLLNLLLGLSAIKNIFGNIAQYTIENIVSRIDSSIVGQWVAQVTATEQGVSDYTTKLAVSDFSIFPVIQYIIFFGVAVILAAVAFRKKELEF